MDGNIGFNGSLYLRGTVGASVGASAYGYGWTMNGYAGVELTRSPYGPVSITGFQHQEGGVSMPAVFSFGGTLDSRFNITVSGGSVSYGGASGTLKAKMSIAGLAVFDDTVAGLSIDVHGISVTMPAGVPNVRLNL